LNKISFEGGVGAYNLPNLAAGLTRETKRRITWSYEAFYKIINTSNLKRIIIILDIN
jgi:hypothetical protein